jgi:hypothetical protein
MAVTINASTSAGLVNTADTSGILALQTAGTTAVSISSGQVATFAQAPVLPAASIPQAALAAGVAGNGPAFSAYPSAAQSVANNTFTIINGNVELFDTASCYNNTGSTVGGIPAYSFLPNVAGYYQVNAAWFTGTSANGVTSGIYKNGAIYQQTTVQFYAGGQVLGVNCLVYLNGSSDYIGFYVLQGQGSTYTTLAARPDLNYFAASMVRSA